MCMRLSKKVNPEVTFAMGGGSSLEVQWLRLTLPIPGAQVWSLVRVLWSHMPCGQRKERKKEAYKMLIEAILGEIQ